tara:strand:- start:14513 stop:15058 length:546 start_codon:yes stop_codon:yes gene_type:complete
MKKLKKPTNKILDKIDMTSILENIPKSDTNLVYIDAPSGEEHYRLLAWLGSKVKGDILELGTFRGHSALCLAKDGLSVISFDIEDHLSITEKPENIFFEYAENGHHLINDSVDLVFIDTMHDGIYEAEVLNHLRSISWKGIVIMDDIVLFPELAKIWESIPEQKEDWTDIGHHSGTGIIYF